MPPPSARPLTLVIGGYDPIVTCFAAPLSCTAPALTLLSSSDCGVHPSYLAVSPCGARAYAVQETPAGSVTALLRCPETGALIRINTCSSGGDDPCHISVSPCGRWVLVSNYSSGSLALLAVRPDGGLEPHAVLSPGANTHQAVFAEGGRVVHVACLGSDAVRTYALDAEAGVLTLTSSASLAPGAGPRHLVLSPCGTAAYVLNELDMSLATFSVERPSGRLVGPLAVVSTLPPGLSARAGWSCAHVLLSRDGRTLIASNRGHDSLCVWRLRAAGDTQVAEAPASWETAGGVLGLPRDFALSPEGSLLAVASQSGDSVTLLALDEATSALKVGTTHALPGGRGRRPCFVGWW